MELYGPVKYALYYLILIEILGYAVVLGIFVGTFMFLNPMSRL